MIQRAWTPRSSTDQSLPTIICHLLIDANLTRRTFWKKETKPPGRFNEFLFKVVVIAKEQSIYIWVYIWYSQMYQVCQCQVVLFISRNRIQLIWAVKTWEQLKLNMYKTFLKSFRWLIPNFHTKQWTGASFLLAGESNAWLDVSLKAWNHASTVCQQLVDLGEFSCNSFNINYMVLIKHQTFHTCSFHFQLTSAMFVFQHLTMNICTPFS